MEVSSFLFWQTEPFPTERVRCVEWKQYVLQENDAVKNETYFSLIAVSNKNQKKPYDDSTLTEPSDLSEEYAGNIASGFNKFCILHSCAVSERENHLMAHYLLDESACSI